MIIKKPLATEYPPTAADYISLVPGDIDVLQTLQKQRDNMAHLFASINEEEAQYRYEEGKWSIKEILGHIIDTERTFAYRVLAFSRSNVELPGFDQDVYIQNSNYHSQPLTSLIEEYIMVRNANLHLFNALNNEQLCRTGIASGYPVSVGALIYMIAGHELHHLNILRGRYLNTLK